MEWRSHMMRHLQGALHPLFVVLGPTASGKTAFSLDLAQEIERAGKSAEIVNADSRQLYRLLDIGTAKVTRREMRGIPHHLLSVLDPKEKVTAAWFKEHAVRAIDGILARGNVPILVGGSMLYISAVTDGYVFTGRGKKEARGTLYDLHILGVARPREELMGRIDERTKDLFHAGWIDEVRMLAEKGYGPEDPGMESHGYREIMRFLKEGRPTESELLEDIAAKTRQYAKRQMTWWRRDRRILWLNPYFPHAACDSSLCGSADDSGTHRRA